MNSRSQATLAVAQWELADFSWHMPGRSFEFRVDNRIVADWLTGGAAVVDSRFAGRVASAINLLC
eukprot:4659347-Karenia_brevis.AAC.1